MLWGYRIQYWRPDYTVYDHYLQNVCAQIFFDFFSTFLFFYIFFLCSVRQKCHPYFVFFLNWNPTSVTHKRNDFLKIVNSFVTLPAPPSPLPDFPLQRSTEALRDGCPTKLQSENPAHIAFFFLFFFCYTDFKRSRHFKSQFNFFFRPWYKSVLV